MLDNYINPAKYSGVAKEDTLQEVKNTVESIDLSSVESKVDEIGNKIDNIQLPEIDTTELAKKESLI